MNAHRSRSCRLTVLSAALLAAYGPAWSADDELRELTKPSSTVSLGVGSVSSNNWGFGQYNGLNRSGGYGLLDLDIRRRDDATGTWLILQGRNLGLSSRELRFENRRQGNWGYFLEYTESPRYEPYTLTTAVQNIGSANIVVPTSLTAGGEQRIKMDRTAFTLGFDKRLPARWDFRITFRSEDKDGARLFARGTTGGAGLFEFAPEPLDSTTQQIEARLGYNGRQFQMIAGYYGSLFNNRIDALTITGGAAGLRATPNNYINPIALPPDNEAHQLYLQGGYSFSPTTRATFKLATGRYRQNNAFIDPSPTAVLPGQSSLDARVDTSLLQVGLSARPTKALSLRANYLYDDRDDQTSSIPGTPSGLYVPRSVNTQVAKLEAIYRLPMGFRLMGGFDVVSKERSVPADRAVQMRDRTDEDSLRLELRRSLSDTVNGSIGWVRSDRNGSEWLGAAGSVNVIDPLSLADRTRDKWRAVLDWAVSEQLGLQFVVEESRDEYDLRAGNDGVRSGKGSTYSIDASYSLSENWRAGAWAVWNKLSSYQETIASGSTPTSPRDWSATLSNRGEAFGLSLRGKATDKLSLGADLLVQRDRGSHIQVLTPGYTVSYGTVIPEMYYKVNSLRVYGIYAIQRNMGVRLDVVHERRSTDDWTWGNWRYIDGTTLWRKPHESVTFLGVSGYYRFW